MKNRKGAKLLFVILIAALFIFIGSANALAQNVLEPQVVTVTANPLWTNTGIYVTAGEMVAISAKGQWAIGNNYFGPDGISFTSQDTFLYEGHRGTLIAYVGTDPYQGHWGDRNFFPQHNGSGYFAIGSSKFFTSDRSGYLWLGFNDDAVTKNTFDNFGSVTARIYIERLVEIDIIPNKTLNAIDFQSNKNIPVAIFGSSTFDVTTIDSSSVTALDSYALPKKKLKDINSDGYLDMVIYFEAKSMNTDFIWCDQWGDDRIFLTGSTISGTWLIGSDIVVRK